MGGVDRAWVQQLAPDHAPPPPGWWPPAPGWWLLLALVVVLVAPVIRRQRPERRLRSAALRELAELSALADTATLAPRLAMLTRRFALARYPRADVASLCGSQWVRFVVEHGGRDWDNGVGEALLQAAYGGDTTTHRAAWIRGARDFIRSRA